MRRRALWLFLLPLALAGEVAPGFARAAGPDLKDCLAEAMPAKQIACLAKAAITGGDPNLCLEAARPSVRWRCVALYADRAGEPSLCGILPESEGVPASVSRDYCHVQLAVTRRDPTLCDGLTTPNLADGCYLELVKTGGDRALCQRIANPDVRSVCAFDPEKFQ